MTAPQQASQRSPIVRIVLFAIGIWLLWQTWQSVNGHPAGVVTAEPTQRPAIAQPLSRSVQSARGHAIANTAPLALVGDYVVDWTATPDDDAGCYHGATLEAADDQGSTEFLVNEIIDGAAAKSGQTRLYGLASGRWYIAVNSGCAWTFQFTPA